MKLVTSSPPPTSSAVHRPARGGGEACSSSGSSSSRAIVMPEIVEESRRGNEKVHVAVGRSVERAVVLIQLTIRRFGDGVEVKASIITTEADLVQKGLMDLVSHHGIRKLVMGALPNNCMKMKRSSRKANYAVKTAPLFCELWFVYKGQHVWTREATESPIGDPTSNILVTESLRPKSLRCDHQNELLFLDHPRVHSARQSIDSGKKDWIRDCEVQDEETLTLLLPSGSAIDSSTQSKVCESSSYEYEMEADLHVQLSEAMAEAMSSAHVAHGEILNRKKLEGAALLAISKVKELESTHASEAKLTEEAEQTLRIAVQEHERLLEEKLKATGELQKALRNLSVVDSRLQEANRRCDEATGEFELIQASMGSLHQEKLKIHKQKMESVHWLERWRSHRQADGVNKNAVSGLDNISELVEFSLLDMQTATCNLSDRFKLGEGEYGCVYKGELLDKTVAIKMFDARNMQGPSEFQKEGFFAQLLLNGQFFVQVLGKLRHPHLVPLIGACPEAWSLVYDYLPNGNLQSHLFQRSKSSLLTWMDRARIISEISSAILFLHSSHPEKIVHGGLKPENILLQSDLRCRLSDYGIFRLVTKEILRCPSFRRYYEPKGAFPYTDPEFHRTGILTPNSDVYSLGVVILQLLTGKPPEGLAADIRRAVLFGNLASVIDHSAGDWPTSVVGKLVRLGLRFCEPNSRDQPELTPAVVWELQQLHTSEERPIPSYFLCPILQEIMHHPVIAADGFTYEAEALRGWLVNGRGTSPMTNLRLNHLLLTPNHILRLTIQEWLCR
ncbi:U-box domain-containing protein [Drosera capensis]